MTENTTKETLMYLRQCLLPGNVQDGIDLEVPSWLVREAVSALAMLSKMEEALDIERLAAIEHSQWMAWARTLMDEEPGLSEERRERWQSLMVDYSELPDEIKEYDREWARIVIGEALAGGDEEKAGCDPDQEVGKEPWERVEEKA